MSRLRSRRKANEPMGEVSELIEYRIRESIVEPDFVYGALGARATVMVGDFLVASFASDHYEDAATVREELEKAIRSRLFDLGIETGPDQAMPPLGVGYAANQEALRRCRSHLDPATQPREGCGD